MTLLQNYTKTVHMDTSPACSPDLSCCKTEEFRDCGKDNFAVN